LGPSGRV